MDKEGKNKKFNFKISSPKIVLLIIILLYSAISFYKLGSTKNPQTMVSLASEEQLIYEINGTKNPSKIFYYTGYNSATINVFFLTSPDDFTDYIFVGTITIKTGDVFSWETLVIDNEIGIHYKYLMLEAETNNAALGEMKVYDNNNDEIKITPLDSKSKMLVDEQKLVPKEKTYMNSTYFDEVYFPRTAYEQLNNLPIYEYTHPPLGKLLISIPVSIFGVTPFAYRLGGNIAGILMLLVFYLIAKELLKREKFALFSTAILALDGMHFVQTRLGTVDSYLLLFCLTSFLFFIKYIKIPNSESLKKKLPPLMLSGIFWGLAMSTKWTASYIGLGMGIIYLFKFIAGKKLDFKLLGISVLSFIVIPISIYILTYIPIITNPNSELTYTYTYSNKKDEPKYFDKSTIKNIETINGSTTVTYSVKIKDIKTFIEYQKIMYTYHSRLDDNHTYSSKWYSWPIMTRPLWYYIGRFDDGTVGTIACMGNPAIWYLGIITTAFTLIYSVLHKNKEGLTLVAMIFATWLPYSFIRKNNVYLSLFHNNTICNVNNTICT